MILLSHNLKAFVTVVECGTLVAAAKKLGLTQTGLTQRIKTLEKELDSTLFTRSRKGMHLTAEGESILQYCIQANELEGQALSGIKNRGTESEISITLTGPTSVVSARVSEQLLHIYNLYPKLNLNLQLDDSENRIDLLKQAKAHLVIVRPYEVPNEVNSKLLKPDQFVLVGHPSWKGRKLSKIIQEERIIDFHNEDPTTLNYLKKFNLESHIDRPRLYVNENSTLISYFCTGIGYGTLTKEIAKPHLDQKKLILLNNGKFMEDKLALAWYPRKEMPLYFRDIIRAIK